MWILGLTLNWQKAWKGIQCRLSLAARVLAGKHFNCSRLGLGNSFPLGRSWGSRELVASRQALIGHLCLSRRPVRLLPSQARAHGEGGRGSRQQAAGHAPLDAFPEDTPPSSSPAVRFPPLQAQTPFGACFAVDSLDLSEELWKDKAYMLKVLEKLHVQFSHLPIGKLVPMPKSIRSDKGTGMLSTVADKFVCNHCTKFSKAKPHPVVAVPRVPTVNHQVYIDVFWVKGIMFLHMACAFSAYRQAAILTERKGQAVVFALLNFWLRYLGPMRSLRKDLGSEFDSKDVTELAERYGIEVDRTLGGAHWAGGGH